MSDPAPLVCPECGHDQLHWELHRLRTRNHTLTLKVVRWDCRRCGHVWVVPTLPTGPEMDPLVGE